MRVRERKVEVESRRNSILICFACWRPDSMTLETMAHLDMPSSNIVINLLVSIGRVRDFFYSFFSLITFPSL